MMNKGYAFEHAGQTFAPSGKVELGGSVAEHNAQLERGELAVWEGKPDRALAYFKFPVNALAVAGTQYRANYSPRLAGATVSTWLGTELGKVTEARVYRHNFGARFVSLRVLGTNGAEYWGRASWDGGNCVILRKVRSR